MGEQSYKRFRLLPPWVQATYAKPSDVAPANRHEPILWGGLDDPPPVGTRVVVRFNNLGSGTVKGYFVEAGWLGLLVALDRPPEWWRQQNKQNPKRQCHVFGPEFRRIIERGD